MEDRPQRAAEITLEEDGEGLPSIPSARVLLISGVALATAVAINLLWPESGRDYPGLVWVLGLVPLCLFAYHKGWSGAAVATGAVMVAFTLVEGVAAPLLGGGVDWWFFAVATGLAVAVTVGTGTVAELLHRRRKAAVQLALHDSLTGLPNRRLLRLHAEKAIASARRTGSRVALVFLDLVRFKRVNDTLGHEAGDEVLAAVARRLREDSRDADTVARIGGDEFAVLLGEVASADDTLAAARRLRDCLSRPFEVEDRQIRLSSRLGVALHPDHGTDFKTLLSRADRAVYRSGQLEDLHISFFESPDEEASPQEEALILEDDLERAIEEEQLEVHYQPVADVGEERIVGAEALLRWDHPRQGLLTAGSFIGTAERSGLIGSLDTWVLETVIEQAAGWVDRLGFDWFALNLLPSFFDDPGFVEKLEATLASHDLDPGSLVFEITERAAVRDDEATAATLSELRELGLRVAVDDFGTGHSSLSYLRRIPTDLLKLDMMFMEGIGEDAMAERLVDGVVALGHSMGRTVLAEGVETAAQYDWLRNVGCDMAQGYHVGRPAPLESLHEVAVPAAGSAAATEGEAG